ncbi:MAG: hypothetical protein ACREQI_09935 [Candidatus Binataceae bacterium]
MRDAPVARRRLVSLAIAAAAAAMLAAGCAKLVSLPPQATATEIVPSGRAAKPPDCNLPVLRYKPLRPYREVAIVEGTGNVYDREADVLPAVMRAACGTGADAIVILTSRSQTSETLTGYYIDAAAIVYGSQRFAPQAPQAYRPWQAVGKSQPAPSLLSPPQKSGGKD